MDAFPAQYAPSYSTAVMPEWKVLEAAMGDGYKQRSPDGINSKRLVLQIIYSKRPAATVAAVLAFLQAQGSTAAWTWTAPAPFNDKERQWVCRPAPRLGFDSFDAQTLSFVIEEDFNPPL